MKRTRREIRNSSFRLAFKDRHRPRWQKRSKPVPGGSPRSWAKLHRSSPLDLRDVRFATGWKSAKEVAADCRAGRLPTPRFDRINGMPFWHRLEFEAHRYWQRAVKVRRPKPNVPTDSQKLSDLLGIPVAQSKTTMVKAPFGTLPSGSTT